MSASAIELSARLVFALCSFSLMAVILALIRGNAIKEKYVLLWLPLGAGFFLVSLFPDLLLAVSARIQLHYITVVLLGVILVYTGILLYFTTRLSQLREDMKELAQEMALARAREPRMTPESPHLLQAGKSADPGWIPAPKDLPVRERPEPT